MLPVRIFDYVLHDIGERIGRVAPEQGGALLGLRGQDVVTSFIHDPEAPVTQVEYRNTGWLLQEITRREAAGPERFKGIVHSHPRRTPRPSQQDRFEYGRALAAIPELGRYIAPIVTHDAVTPLQQHECAIDGARVSFFGAAWSADAPAIRPMRPVVVPLAAACRRAGLPWPDRQPATFVLDGVHGVRVALAPDALPEASGRRWSLFATADFPFSPPTLIGEDDHGDGGGGARCRVLPWDLHVPAEDRLARALAEVSAERSRRGGIRSGAMRRQSPAAAPESDQPSDSPAPSDGPAEARLVPQSFAGPEGEPPEGTPPRPGGTGVTAAPDRSGGPGAAPADSPGGRPRKRWGRFTRTRMRLGLGRRRAVRGALFARTQGLLSPDLADKHVLLVGVGSVGSYLADLLVRSGVGRLTLVDPDHVEPANLGRSLFTTRDIGRHKAKATARRLKKVHPRVRVRTLQRDVAALDNQTWLCRISEADLVIAATDDNAAQQRLNHLSYASRTPAVFVGLYEGAAGGEVVFTRPGLPCWACSTGGVRETLGGLGIQPRTDYGTGRSYAVPGLLPDIHHVTSAAAKVALALLHEPRGTGHGSERISGFLARPEREKLPMVLFATEPDHWFFPRVLGEAPGQYAFQSVWLRTASRAECAVCGPLEARSDPADYRGSDDGADATRRRRETYERRRREGSRAGG